MENERSGNLIEYFKKNKDRPFSWPNHNCMTFTSEYVELVTGEPLFPSEYLYGNGNWKRAYKSSKRFFQDFGHSDIVSYVDTRLDRVLTLYPEDGLIVAKKDPFGYIFGLTLEDYCFFLTEKDGLLGLKPEGGNVYWRVK